MENVVDKFHVLGVGGIDTMGKGVTEDGVGNGMSGLIMDIHLR